MEKEYVLLLPVTVKQIQPGQPPRAELVQVVIRAGNEVEAAQKLSWALGRVMREGES